MTNPASPPVGGNRSALRAALAWWLALFACISVVTTRAAEPAADGASRRSEAKKAFDIPAGDAFTTLKRFAAQSGAQLIYQAEALEGVRTVAVRGQFTAHEALGRMLVRTALSVTRDAQSGTLAITRAAATRARNGASDPPPEPTSSAKKKSPSP